MQVALLWPTLMVVAVATMSMMAMMMKRRRGRRQCITRPSSTTSEEAGGRLRLPPMPGPGWPVVGHLSVYARGLRAELFKELTELKKKLGPILCVKVGRHPVIIISSTSLAQEALLARGSLFATRPPAAPRPLFSSIPRSIVNAPYGDYWRAVRRNITHGTLSPAVLLAFKPCRATVLDRLARRLRALPPGSHVEVHWTCRLALTELTLAMCLGFLPDADADDRVAAVAQFLCDVAPLTLWDFFPFDFRFLDWNKRRLGRRLLSRRPALFASYTEEHHKLRRQGLLIPGNYMESLLFMQADQAHLDAADSTKLSDSDVLDLVSEFMMGGTDSTNNCLEWTMAHLVADPSVQAKIHDEIRQVTAACADDDHPQRPIEERDLESMPYLQAAVKETLRLHPPAPFTLPHGVTEPCQLQGYDIPTDAVVNFDVACISRDSEAWHEPLAYRPERMLGIRDADIAIGANINNAGSQLTDADHQKKRALISMLPFGAGRRVCPGARLGLMHVQLFIARLVQEFQWTESTLHPINMSEKLFFTLQMKYPLKALIIPRAQRPAAAASNMQYS